MVKHQMRAFRKTIDDQRGDDFRQFYTLYFNIYILESFHFYSIFFIRGVF